MWSQKTLSGNRRHNNALLYLDGCDDDDSGNHDDDDSCDGDDDVGDHDGNTDHYNYEDS